MHLKTYHIVLALTAAALLMEGCTDRNSLDTGGSEIVFASPSVQGVMGSKAILEEGTAFEEGDIISVSAWHERGASGEQRVFGNDGNSEYQEIRCPASGNWIYTPKKKWQWQDSDWYDFVGVAYKRNAAEPPKRVIRQDGISIRKETGSFLTLSVPYDAESGQYDLLMAGTRRDVLESNPSRVVELDFKHMLSAVKVVFYKDVGLDYYILSYHFSNLLASADVQYGWIDGEGFVERTANAIRRSASLFGWTFDSSNPPKITATYTRTNPYDHDADVYDLLLPQDLAPDDAIPQLVVEFKDGGGNVYSRSVDLKLIPQEDDNEKFITEWKPGYKYTYIIGISLDAGVLVRVTTTPWTEIDAKTPGLII